MKTRLCYCLIFSLLICTLILPTYAEETLALTLTQTETAEPGQNVTLSLSLSATELAGGFLTLQYDASLFTLTNVTLLQATDVLTLTYHDQGGSINLLLDAMQNVQIDGAFLSLCFISSEEAQPGTYPVLCTVPDTASFYVLNENGSTSPLYVQGCHAQITLTAPALPTCPARYLACQETNPKNGSISVRLCALLEPDTALSRGNYGFVCAVTDQNGTRELTLGGSEIFSEIEGGGKIYTAEQLGGNIFTAALTVPAEGEVSITLTPYVRIDNMTLYAGTYTILYANGSYIGTSLVF